jgi:hypothetical protein
MVSYHSPIIYSLTWSRLIVSGATLGYSITCIIAAAVGEFLKNLLFTISSGLGGPFLYQLVFRS